MSDRLEDERRRPRAVRIEAPHAAQTKTQEAPGAGQTKNREAPGAGQTKTQEAPRARESVVEIMPDPYAFEAGLTLEPGEAAIEAAQRRGIVRKSLVSWGGLFWSALGGLASLGAGLWVTQIVDGLFARSAALGIAGLVLAGLALLALIALGTREIWRIGRQTHIAKLHQDFARARAADDRIEARHLVTGLAALYKGRPETARARKSVLSLRAEIVDGRDLIDIAERSLVTPLDGRAKAAIAAAAKRVSLVTAVAPRAFIDVAFVLFQAVRLIRDIAEIYGGRPGLFGFIKLARSVVAHLAITGGMAAGDSLLSQVVGHGIAAKISARLGEGMLNGLMTARIGLSAMAVCRPMPFATEPPPALRTVVPFLFRPEKSGQDKSGQDKSRPGEEP